MIPPMLWCQDHERYYHPSKGCPECEAEATETATCDLCEEKHHVDAVAFVSTPLGDYCIGPCCQYDYDTGEPTDKPNRWLDAANPPPRRESCLGGGGGALEE